VRAPCASCATATARTRWRAAEVYRPVAGWYDYFDYATYVWGVPARAKVLRVHDAWFANGTPVVFELEGG
jgi:hypothetical protein